MAAQLNQSKTRRAWLACAASSVALLLVVWGCLNPRPDDYPSRGNTNPIDVPEPPSGEDFCDRNPLAQDCDDSGGNALDPGNAGNQPDPNEPDPSEPDPSPSVDAGVVDAGAPDATPNANK